MFINITLRIEKPVKEWVRLLIKASPFINWRHINNTKLGSSVCHKSLISHEETQMSVKCKVVYDQISFWFIMVCPQMPGWISGCTHPQNEHQDLLWHWKQAHQSPSCLQKEILLSSLHFFLQLWISPSPVKASTGRDGIWVWLRTMFWMWEELLKSLENTWLLKGKEESCPYPY